MQGIIWEFTCVFTQYIKCPDDPDQHSSIRKPKVTRLNEISKRGQGGKMTAGAIADSNL